MNKDTIYDENLTNDDYHADDAISRSQVMSMRKSPAHYYYRNLSGLYSHKEVPPIITSASPLGFGNAAHTFILEKDKFLSEYHVYAQKHKRTTKEGKAEFAECEKEAGDRQIISLDSVDILHGMSNAINSDVTANALIQGVPETSFFWTDKETGFRLKSRPDILNLEGEFITDLKTVRSADARTFQHEVYDYGYHLQAAMQQIAVKEVLGIEIKDFYYVAVEKEMPYAHTTYKLDDSYLEIGHTEFRSLLNKIAKCKELNDWPSYDMQIIAPPKYIIDRVFN